MTPLFQVDAFASAPFTGNPAAVCLLDSQREASWMQAVAAEMNLSETAFVWRESEGMGLRWFTPAVEVALCGHATLSAAHILWETGEFQRSESIVFQTASGSLESRLRDGWIELDFPRFEATPVELPPRIAAAVTDTPIAVHAVDDRGQREPTFLLELPSEAAVRGLVPQLHGLRYPGASSIIVTAIADRSDFDFVSRFFAPSAGIDEDPVTGSAHCSLAPYWSARLGKDELLAFQASRRGGVVAMGLTRKRVLLRGQAVTVFGGDLRV